MITVPLLNEETEAVTTYNRFSRIVFNNRLGTNPSAMITKGGEPPIGTYEV